MTAFEGNSGPDMLSTTKFQPGNQGTGLDYLLKTVVRGSGQFPQGAIGHTVL
jgi:hypothetical protein